MTWTLGAKGSATWNDSAGQPSAECLLDAAIAVGDLIFVTAAFGVGDGATGGVVTDDLGNTYLTDVASKATDTDDAQMIQSFVSVATVAGTPMVTVRFLASPGTTVAGFISLNVRAVTPTSAGYAIYGAAAQWQASPTTATDATTSGTYSVPATGDVFVWTGCEDSGSGADPGAVGTGFTIDQTSGSPTLKTAYQISNGASTVAGLWTATVDASHITSSIAVALSGGGSVTVNPTGFGLTVSLGTPTLTNTALKVLPTGYGLTVSLGTPSVHNGSDPFLTPTGYGLTATLGTPSVKLSGVRVSPTGFGLTISEGSFTTQNDITLTGITGYGLATSLGTPVVLLSGVQENPSGFALSTTLGTPLVRLSQVLKPTGFGLTVSLGTPTLGGSPHLSPPGFGLTMSLGTPTVSTPSSPTILPTGFALAVSLGTPTISTFQAVTVAPAGFGLTVSLGSAFVIDGSTVILLLGTVRQLNTTPRARQLITTPIVRRPHA